MPGPPQTMSFPPRAVTVSLPPRASITSAPPVPVSWSPPAVPRMVGVLFAHGVVTLTVMVLPFAEGDLVEDEHREGVGAEEAGLRRVGEVRGEQCRGVIEAGRSGAVQRLGRDDGADLGLLARRAGVGAGDEDRDGVFCRVITVLSWQTGRPSGAQSGCRRSGSWCSREEGSWRRSGRCSRSRDRRM